MPKEPKPKLTPEERKALKAAKKEEKKRLKIEKAKQLKRDYLGREIQYGDLTIKRYEKKWRQMLINLALPKMREDLEFAWHNFERVIDCKNFTISLLMDEIREAEEQYMMNIRSHVGNIDRLIDMFQGRLEELQEEYDQEIAELQKQGEEEARQIRLTAEEEENYLKTMLHILELIRKEQKQNVRAEYFGKLEEGHRKYKQTVNTLKGILEKKLRQTVKDTINFFANYKRKTKARRQDHDELKVQDDALQKLLVDQLEKIRKDCEYIKILKVKLSDSQKILGSKLRDIQEEHELFAYVFSTLKSRLERDRKKDVQQLICVITNNNEAIEYLQELKKKEERLLSISAVCRKLETQEEKIQPFPEHLHEEETPLPTHAHGDTLSTAEEVVTDMKEFIPEMRMFWQRVAQADASRYAINEEREFLRTQNELLKMKLYQYCRCISCPAPDRNIVARGVKNVTEGVLELQKYSKQNVLAFSTSRPHFDIDT